MVHLHSVLVYSWGITGVWAVWLWIPARSRDFRAPLLFATGIQNSQPHMHLALARKAFFLHEIERQYAIDLWHCSSYLSAKKKPRKKEKTLKSSVNHGSWRGYWHVSCMKGTTFYKLKEIQHNGIAPNFLPLTDSPSDFHYT